MDKLTLVSSNACCGGYQKVFSHISEELQCPMKFAIFLPPSAEGAKNNVPVVFWLSGLCCTEQNFITKAGAQRYAAELGLVIVCPDTSPREVNIPGEDDSYDFGSGAGFYLDAELEPWKKNYRMFSYVTKELNKLIVDAFECVDGTKQGILGHSMGGHGAMICALKNPGLYKSVSAFAPICNPIQCSWGVKAFTGYLGEKDKAAWKDWDTVELVKKYNGPPMQLYVDQGSKDEFYEKKQLLPENLVQACRDSQMACILNMREDYDHSYYFIATYIKDHMTYHAKILKA